MRMRKEVFILNIDDILPNRFQPRIKFDEKAILELSESIKKHGVIQPIIVRKIADKYEIIAGERRYKASVIAGRKTIPAIITDIDDKESAEVALTENVQRQDMTPIEEALSYKKILDMGYLNQSELAIKLGKTQSTIANKLRLLNLSDEVQEALLEEQISERHARSLLRLPKEEQPNILNRIIKERLTVRKTDQLINSILNPNENEIKEEKGDNMNNNFNEVNNNFNIPSEPIIDNSNNNQNPGFMNIDNIANNAQDIQPVQNNGVGEKEPFNPFGVQEPVQPEKPAFNPFGAPEQPQGGFNPFSMNEAPAAPQPEPVQPEAPAFNPFGGAPKQPQGFNPFSMNEVPAAPQPEPAQPEAPAFNPFGAPEQPQGGFNPFSMNEAPAAPQPEPVQQEAPAFNPFSAPEQPQGGFNPFSMNEAPAAPQPEPVQQEAPAFNPFGGAPEQPQGGFNPFETSQSIPEVNPAPFVSTPNYPLPETQELTPLMPEVDNKQQRVDLNTVINTMRDCIKQIEGMGYKVDSDELDLPGTYEFTIKIDKN